MDTEASRSRARIVRHGCDVSRAGAERCGGLPGNAACCSDAVPSPWLVVSGRDSPRNPPPSSYSSSSSSRLSSPWAGTARKRASETQHPEDGERRGGRRDSVNDVRVSGGLQKVRKDSSLSGVHFLFKN